MLLEGRESAAALAALHSSASCEHGSPPHIVEMAREVLGRIECDPFTSDYWNLHTVRAGAIFTAEESALTWNGRWTSAKGAPYWRTFYINAPSGLVKECWDFATTRWHEGSAVFWLGFNIEQLAYLQRAGVMFPGFRRCIPPGRLAFLQPRPDAIESLLRKAAKAVARGGRGDARLAERLTDKARNLATDPAGPPVLSESPTHSNYIALLPGAGEPGQIERFDAEAARLGARPF